MIEKFFLCTLKSDVVLNSSLATEGAINSLDYIPGSVFLGIVAKKYDEFGQDAYEIFHSGKVSFGDAHISDGLSMSVKVPYSLYVDKLHSDITKDNVWVFHGIENFDIKGDNDKKIQLKQVREGYLTPNGKYFKHIEKVFYQKSAYDADKRRAEDSKMFGLEALKKGQKFVFSVLFENEKLVDKVTEALVETHFIGKSKSAQYGTIEIKTLDQTKTFTDRESSNNQLIIYALSNLCFFNEYGQPTFQPTPEDFGLKSENSRINWEKSQLRTHSYQIWNTKRNTPDTQRNVILKGSVIVIDTDEKIDISQLPKLVGHYRAEGLGRVLYNPEFLEYSKNGLWNYKVEKIETQHEQKADNTSQVQTPLGKLLIKHKQADELELKISEEVYNIINANKYASLWKNVTSSQWGMIRQYALRAKNIDELKKKLFDEDTGILTTGVAAERYWDKNGGKVRELLKEILKDKDNLGTTFIAVLASEIAKKSTK